MYEPNIFSAIAGGLALFGGFAFFLYQEIKPPRKKSEYNKPREYIPHAAPKPKPVQPKPAQKPVKQPVKAQINPETLKAMHKQADAERGIAEALERKMLHTPDPIKHARLEKQSANSWLRFNKILDQIDKLTMQ